MKKPIFAMIPSGYKASTLYTPIPIDGSGDFTVTRNTVATRMNKDGLIEEMASNMPRLDYKDSNCPSLLIEPASTNFMTDSSDLIPWFNTLITVDSNVAIAPDGTTEADKITRTSTSPNYISDFFTKSASAKTYTSSIFVKRGNTDELALLSQGDFPARIDLRYNFATNSIYYTNPVSGFLFVGSNVENYPNGWIRLSWTYTSDAHTVLTGITLSPRLSSDNAYSSDTSTDAFCYVWGGQCEESEVATSYIETTGTLVTRVKDVLGDTLNAEVLKDVNTEGSLYFHFKPLNDGIPFKGIELADATNGHRVLIRQDGDNSYAVYYQVGGASNAYLVFLLDPNTQYHKVVVVWKQGTIQVYLNGVLVNENLTFDLTGVQQFTLFTPSAGGGGQYWYGSARELMVFNEFLTEAEAIELTTI